MALLRLYINDSCIPSTSMIEQVSSCKQDSSTNLQSLPASKLCKLLFAVAAYGVQDIEWHFA